MKWKAMAARTIIPPGKKEVHQCPASMSRAPSLTITPHSAVGGLMPTPRNANPDTVRMAQPATRVAVTREGLQRVGKDMQECHPTRAVAGQFGPVHIFEFPFRERLGAGEADEVGDERRSDRYPHVEGAVPEHRHQNQSEDEPGKGQHDVGDSHQGLVHGASPVTGHHADRRTYDHRANGYQYAQGQVEPSAVNSPGEDIAAEIVGSHGMLQGGGKQGVGRIGRHRVGHEEGADGRQQDVDAQDDHPHHRQRLAGSQRESLGAAVDAGRNETP